MADLAGRGRLIPALLCAVAVLSAACSTAKKPGPAPSGLPADAVSPPPTQTSPAATRAGTDDADSTIRSACDTPCPPPTPERSAAPLAAAPPVREHPCRPSHVDFTGAMEMTIRDLSRTEDDDVTELAARFDGAVPRDEPRALARFPLGRRFPVVLASGTSSAEVVGWSAINGAEGPDYTVQLQAAPGTPSGEALVLSAARAPPGARLDHPTPLDLNGDVGVRLLEALATRLPQTADGSTRLQALRVTTWPARLPAPHRYLVTLGIACDDEQIPGDDCVSGLVLADGRGEVSGVVEDIERRIDRFTLRYLFDLEGDGIDEALVASDYYEGHYEHLLRFREGKPELITLAGVGL